ncbi:Pvc16 family protein [Mesobacterium pallidum]|uniref:Pvc16 family protein n=1 Tax=Mesobacterium pallidum TaxID=2872037 RepID=UPI001EE2A306|nr:Pvc16 family protein [Mesobacterium pallidum]
MALGPSSLSTAIQGFAEYLTDRFPEGVTVTVDTPQRASEQAKNAQAGTDILNVFVYRLAPSGFHADRDKGEPEFVRASILLTPFPRAQDEDGATDLDLRILGHAIAVIQSDPVMPLILPATPGSPEAAALAPQTTFYQMQCVMQAPAMEEMNHIWTTQGGELAYRLSAAFELALIPVEPLAYVTPPTPVRAAVLDVRADAVPGLSPTPMGVVPGNWLPVVMFRDAGGLTSTLTVAPGAANAPLALTGLPGGAAEVIVEWTREDGTEEAQAPQDHTVTSGNLDDPGAAIAVTLIDAATGDRARIYARPKAPPGATAGNVLMLTVGGA